MSGRTRLFSEFTSDLSGPHTSPFNRAIIASRINTSPMLAGTDSQDCVRLIKRRRTTGLNSRFDRMMEAISVPRRPQAKSGHQRTPSAGSSSVGSHGFPKTPVDAYSTLEEGKLGKTFSVIKLDSPSVPRTGALGGNNAVTDPVPAFDSDISTNHQSKVSQGSLPEWLSTTFVTLNPQHPLRLLLPSSSHLSSEMFDPDDQGEGSIQSIPRNETEDSVFALLPPFEQFVVQDEDPGRHVHKSQVWQSGNLPSSPQAHSLASDRVPDFTFPRPPRQSLSGHSSAFSHPTDFPEVLPFSTPGPGSLASQTFLPTSKFNSALLERSTFPPVQPLVDQSPLSSPSRLPPTNGPNADTTALYYSNGTQNDFLTDHSLSDYDSSSDPFLQTAYTNLRPFSTPGPVYHISKAISYDSPADHPADYDPSQPGHELDYDTLNFHWKPFDRNSIGNDGITRHRTASVHSKMFSRSSWPVMSQSSPPTSYTVRIDGSVSAPPAKIPDIPIPKAFSSLTASPERCVSPSPFRFACPMDDAVLDHHAHLPTTELPDVSETFSSTSEQQEAPSFAPTPGIFISPLRNSQSSQS